MPLVTSSGSRLIRHRAATGNGLLTNLIAYWPMNAAAGANNETDAHTNGLTLTQSGSPGSNTGLVYAAARTPATSKYFTRASETLLNIGAGSFAWAAWVYFDAIANDKGILGKIWGGNGSWYAVTYSASAPYYLRFGLRTTQNATKEAAATETLPTGTWTLLMGWFDNTAKTINVQINQGTVYSTSIGAYTSVDTADQFTVGAYYAAANAFAGRIGPVALWKGRTLSLGDRTTLYNAGAGLTYAAFTA
jgi:hypothetical protein